MCDKARLLRQVLRWQARHIIILYTDHDLNHHLGLESWIQIIVYLLLTYGTHIHKAHHSALAYLVTQNPISPLLRWE